MRVEARAVSKRFGRVQALRGLDFQVPGGRRLALVGPNGSGKSTLLRVLLGLLSFDGEVTLDGVSPREDRLEAARRVAYVPQVAPGLAAPVRELVRVLAGARGVAPDEVGKCASRLGLDLEGIAERPLRGLSGGMRQKLMVALAFASGADLLLLDEPTGSLDARSRERFFALFAEAARGATVILCSHRLEEVRQLVDHVLLLEEGSIAWDGPAPDFLAASTTGTVEVRATGDAAARWLTARGFLRGAGDWWLRTVTLSEKLALLPEIARELGPVVQDLSVRDVEALEVGGGGPQRDPEGRP